MEAEFEIKVPKGFKGEFVNGIFRIVKEEVGVEEPRFEVGDLVCCGEIMRIIEGINGGYVESSKKLAYDAIFNENYDLCSSIKEYTKATPEQEALFNQKCLENNVWFDRVNKKWIDIKEGEVYYMNLYNGVNCTIIFKEIYNDDICDHSYYNEKDICKLTISEQATGSIKTVINISEATEEQKQQLFDALKKEGKQWNADKKCIEYLKWKPEMGELYWCVNDSLKVCVTKHHYGENSHERVAIANCYQTQEEAEKYAEYVRECSLNYKP